MKSRYLKDRLIRSYFLLSGISTILILLGIFFMLVINGAKAFKDVSLSEFLFSSTWNPAAYGEAHYGILSLVVSTFMVTLGAMAIAIPLGVGAAGYIAEIAPKKVKEILKPAVEMLASIPSVAIGFLGIVLVGPALVKIFDLNQGLNALNGSILLAIMSLPTIISVSEDAIQSVPETFKEASYGLGATKWTTLTRVILPAAKSGIVASIILGVGRAIGETMTVLMVTGNAPAMPSGFFDSVRTMTATIAIELGEVPQGTTHYYILFAVGVSLFVLTLVFNLLADAFTGKRHRI